MWLYIHSLKFTPVGGEVSHRQATVAQWQEHPAFNRRSASSILARRTKVRKEEDTLKKKLTTTLMLALPASADVDPSGRNVTHEYVMVLLFAAIVAGFLIVDLGWLNRRAHKISIKSAVIQSLFWITLACGYGGLMWAYLSPSMAADFMSAYVTEKMLSVDNLFVIMLLFAFFKIEAQFHHRVLFWGILGAVVLRGAFIGVGAAIVSQFHWILYLFGALLIYSAWKLLFRESEDPDFTKTWYFRLCQKYLPITSEEHRGHFFLGGCATTMFLTLVMIEITDVIFAVDSIPAVLAITSDPFVAFTSNIFAVMGLRALFFLVEGVMEKFHQLEKGVAFVLFFIGLKMLLDIFGIHISSPASFGVIIGALGLSLVASVLMPKKEAATAASAK